MQDLIDYLKVSEIIIGLVVMGFTSLLGLFAWWDKRSRRYVDTKTTVFASSNAEVSRRLGAVEADLQRIDKDVVQIRDQMARLPTSADYTELKVGVAEIGATLIQLNGMTQTLYKAAMRASGDNE